MQNRRNTSQSPRFGSRCFVPLGIPELGRGVTQPRRNPLGSGLGVSSRSTLPTVRPAGALLRRNPLGSGLGVSSGRVRSCSGGLPPWLSQSPRFGSRCFVGVAAIKGHRCCVQQACRNPLGSGLGVSSNQGICVRSRRYPCVAIPSVRVSVFRHASRTHQEGIWDGRWVAIPSVRVSVFRRGAKVIVAPNGLDESQSPRFGSRCFVCSYGIILDQRNGFAPVAIPSVRVSVFRPDSSTSQRQPRHCRRRVSQSPRFGSRCFVWSRKRKDIVEFAQAMVAIPSVRVSVFRRTVP